MASKEELREKIRRAPGGPGIYIIRDADGRMMYVGKAKSLRKRLASHFTGKPTPRTRAALVRQKAAEVDWIELKSEAEALILEERVIKEYRPRYNVSLKDDKRYPLLKITKGEEFPRLLIVRVRKVDGSSYSGPYTDASALRETARLIERIFGLRTCRTPRPSERDVLHCLHYNLGYCLAPCIGAVSAEEYAEVVREVELLLAGRSGRLLRLLRKKLEEASRAMDYERAGRLRDMLLALEKIVTRGRRPSGLLSFPAGGREDEERGLRIALGLKGEVRSIEALDISSIMGRDAVGSVICFVNGRPRRRRYRKFRIRSAACADDCAMISEVARRRYGRILREGGELPDLVLVDGGRGQAGAVQEALRSLGMEGPPVAGLAKRNEELFVPGRRKAITLERSSPALKLLQRIRDEAHRLALAYHRSLRRKRLSASRLDDVPGIGPKRKKRLLAAFGTVGKMKRASAEALHERAGIGRRTAERLLEHLGKEGDVTRAGSLRGREGGPAIPASPRPPGGSPPLFS